MHLSTEESAAGSGLHAVSSHSPWVWWHCWDLYKSHLPCVTAFTNILDYLSPELLGAPLEARLSPQEICSNVEDEGMDELLPQAWLHHLEYVC